MHGAAQHRARVVDIFQSYGKNDIERSRLKNVRQLGDVSAFNRIFSLTPASTIVRSAKPASSQTNRASDMNTETPQDERGAPVPHPTIEGAAS